MVDNKTELSFDFDMPPKVIDLETGEEVSLYHIPLRKSNENKLALYFKKEALCSSQNK
jgi:hypothetical protein